MSYMIPVILASLDFVEATCMSVLPCHFHIIFLIRFSYLGNFVFFIHKN